MPQRHVVVDGSNLATEGRTLPSLPQLDQAVREFLAENPDDIVTVVVDASFGHRIDSSEVQMFEEAELAGEVVSPPAGAIGRGDAFLLRIAEKTGATVLSNDSFQEFHGEHEWLFDRGRLIGGKPVPGVGWIFTPRIPVRGPKSREAVKEAKRQRRGEEAAAEATGLDLAAQRGRGRGRKVERAIATATEEAVESSDGRRRRRRKPGEAPAEPLNEPLVFITFIAAHPLGDEVIGTVESFASHGAFVEVGEVRCYIPLSGMGEPAPRAARDVLAKGEEQTFVVQALDPLRRGVELALPGFARPAGQPTDETVEAEIWPEADESPDDAASLAAPPAEPAVKEWGAKGAAGPARRPAAVAVPVPESGPAPAAAPAEAKKSPAARKAAARKRGAATKATGAKKTAAVPEAAPAKKRLAAKAAAPTGVTPAKEAQAAKAPAKGVTPAKKSPAKDAAAKKSPAKKTAVKGAPAKEAQGPVAAPAKKVPAAGKVTSAAKEQAPAVPAKATAAAKKSPAARDALAEGVSAGTPAPPAAKKSPAKKAAGTKAAGTTVAKATRAPAKKAAAGATGQAGAGGTAKAVSQVAKTTAKAPRGGAKQAPAPAMAAGKAPAAAPAAPPADSAAPARPRRAPWRSPGQ